jgi:hypothetical protein
MGLRWIYLPDPWTMLKWSAGSALLAVSAFGGILVSSNAAVLGMMMRLTDHPCTPTVRRTNLAYISSQYPQWFSH